MQPESKIFYWIITEYKVSSSCVTPKTAIAHKLQKQADDCGNYFYEKKMNNSFNTLT
jgi:hypothetical protein